MSAFVVCHTHIDALLTFAIANRVSYWDGTNRVTIACNNASEIGRLLLTENERSVAYRYDESDPAQMPGAGQRADEYVYQLFPEPLQPIEILAACDCYDYQACEHPEWASSVARRIVDNIRHTAISKLPGYSEAAWEIRPRQPARRSV